MIRTIVTVPDRRLTTICDPAIYNDDLPKLINDLFDTMYAKDGIGLSAPQIGIMQRVFVMDVRQTKAAHNPIVFINPKILDQNGTKVGREGCLSVPGVILDIPRATHITCALQPDATNTMVFNFWRLEARVIQHEIDHLSGILFTEKAIASEAQSVK